MTRARMSAREALQKLRDGNRRFVANDRCIDTFQGHTRLAEHVRGQAPFAVVLGCSDSRVPVEIVFDVGLGDLFVIRVAGNVVAPSLIGSVELAAELFGARLVVVMGHTVCGAVDIALAAVEKPDTSGTEHVNAIVECIRPAVDEALAADTGAGRESILDAAVRANVRNSVAALRHGSETLERLIRDEGLWIVGAEYALETGRVDFFEGIESGD